MAKASFRNKWGRKAKGPAWSARTAGGLKKAFARSFPYILSLTLVGALCGAVIASALNSPAFALEEVRILNVGTLTQGQAFAFCELQRGENLIRLDLVNVQQVIKHKHPEFKEVQVKRVLPNRVEVVLKRRTPAAQVAFSRYVQVDKDLVILPGSGPAPFKNLTIIEGTPVPRGGLFVGATLGDALTKKAIKLLEVVKRSNVLRKHVLTKIVVTDPNNISFLVDSAIEIRIGNNHFIERLKILDQTLKTIDLDASKIRYIDLRFDDVVVGPR